MTQMSDLTKHLRQMVELSKEIDIPLKNGTIGLTPETIITVADKIEELEARNDMLQINNSDLVEKLHNLGEL